MTTDFGGAEWISRRVPASTRIIRELNRSRVDWVPTGGSLAQSFSAAGPVVAVNLDVVGPRDAADPYTADVKYTLTLETSSGETVAQRTVEGASILWDYFSVMLEVSPPAPAGDYVVRLSGERGEIGWWTSDTVTEGPDDGVSPLPVVGTAYTGGDRVEGARLIGVETLPAPNPVFTHGFEVAEVPASATLTAAVLGTGVIFLNGQRVGTEALEPAVTDYDKTVLYRTWDVGHLLRVGPNEIRIEAGRERWAARGGDIWGWHLAPWHREPTALARLTLTDAGGTEVEIVTDGSWHTSPGAVEKERFFRGEDWVVRASEPEPEHVAVVTPPRGDLRRSTVPPVLPSASVPPVVVETFEHGTVFDFARMMTGRIRCRVSGPAGSSVRVVSGEQRAADGSVVCDNVLVAGEGQLDTLRLDAATDAYDWEIQFGYRGFRWVEVVTEGGAIVDEVRAVPLYVDARVVGAFESDEPVVEWINAATARTFRNNLHGIPTDTPIYEKNGWTADAHLATEGLLHHFDLRAAFGKWVDDHIDAQGADGSIPQIIPTPGWGRATDPAWSASAVLIPWYLYREYGDLDVLDRAAPMIARFAGELIDGLQDGIWRGRTWGDWLSPGYGVGPEGMAPIGTAMSATILQHSAAVMRELGLSDASGYDDMATLVARAYNREYLDADSGEYTVNGVGYRQTLNILPLAFGFVPPTSVDAVRAGLIRDIEHRTEGHLDCGAVGVRHLLPVLTGAGRDDLALDVLTSRTRPGWGVWFNANESTLLESWDVDARSRNHYFLGSVSAWIQQRVGGMRLTEPGWRRFEVAPLSDGRIARAAVRHETPLGTASVEWERGSGGLRLAVTVPEGSQADVRAAGAEQNLGPGSHLLHLPG